MSMPNPSDLTTWKVTGQTERDQIQPGSAPVKGVQIYYQTSKGVTGSIWVPYSQYTTENVRAAIQAAASQMDAVSMLTGGPQG
jgi:hypothetical protein